MQYLIGEDTTRAAAKAAALIVELSRQAIADRGRFAVALAWSDDLAPVYRALAARRDIEWKRWEVFFAEERAVSTEDDRSAWRNVYDNLLARAPLREEKTHAMYALGLDVSAAAEEYAAAVTPVLGDPPVFDLVLLTLGRNADVLGLHPLCPALEETRPVAGVVDPPLDPPVDRVTLTPPAIRAARHLLLAAFGGRHARALRMTLEDGDDRLRIPAQVIRDATGEVTLCLDELLAKAVGVHG
jgi:6-phosphogluconolactonase